MTAATARGGSTARSRGHPVLRIASSSIVRRPAKVVVQGICCEQEAPTVLDIRPVTSCKLLKHSVSSATVALALEEEKGAEMPLQVLESASFFHDTIFVTAMIFLTGAALSDRIYKICTLLSTGFVENLPARATTPPRKPLPDAHFGGATRASL